MPYGSWSGRYSRTGPSMDSARRPRPTYSGYSRGRSWNSSKKSSNMFATKKFVKKAIKQTQELKIFDTAQGNSGVDWAGTIWDISNVAVGTADGSRIGDAINPTSLEFNAVIAAADAYNTFRVIIFRYKPNVVSVTTLNILQAANSTWAPTSPFNHDNRQNFEVLMDESFALDPESDGVYFLKKKLRMAKTKPIQYHGGSATVGQNRIYVLAISDSGAAPNPNFLFSSRLYFTDS